MKKPVFSPQFFSELAEENPLGVELEPEMVEAWWQYIAWPRYKTYKYRDHKRAVTRWWAGVCREDLSRARTALAHAREADAHRMSSFWARELRDIEHSAETHAAITSMFSGRRP